MDDNQLAIEMGVYGRERRRAIKTVSAATARNIFAESQRRKARTKRQTIHLSLASRRPPSGTVSVRPSIPKSWTTTFTLEHDPEAVPGPTDSKPKKHAACRWKFVLTAILVLSACLLTSVVFILFTQSSSLRKTSDTMHTNQASTTLLNSSAIVSTSALPLPKLPAVPGPLHNSSLNNGANTANNMPIDFRIDTERDRIANFELETRPARQPHDDSSDVTEGDMVIETDAITSLQSDYFGPITQDEYDKASRNLWPNAVVPYKFAENTIFTVDEMRQIYRVIDDFRLRSCVQWIPRTNEKAFVIITKNPYLGCASHVGYRVGMRVLSLDNGCFTYGTVYHEMLHSIGFYHEQSRFDRDDFVEIHWENIDEGVGQNFQKRRFKFDPGNAFSPYDYDSVMHYSSTAFSKNGKPTMIPKKPYAYIGQREAPSDVDIWEINKLYNCPNDTRYSLSAVTLPPWAYEPTTHAPARDMPFHCNFERGMCGCWQPWRSAKHDEAMQRDPRREEKVRDDIDWLRNSGETPTPYTGPHTDHTTADGRGYYMYVESSLGESDQSALLVTPLLRPNNAAKYCLSFAYYMHGRSVGSLNVYHEDGPTGVRQRVWSQTGAVGERWEMGSANKTAVYNDFRVVFEVRLKRDIWGNTRNFDIDGDIAIDDVFVTPCEVPEMHLPYKCDFESGWCQLIQGWDDNFDWDRDRRGAGMPDRDGFKLKDDGGIIPGYHALAASQLQDLNDIATLTTPRFNPYGHYCLSFYYKVFGQSYSSATELLAYILQGQKPKPSMCPELRIYVLVDNKQKDYFWRFGGVNVAAVDTERWHVVYTTKFSQSFIQIGFEVKILGQNNDLAIDDIQISPGDCGSNQHAANFPGVPRPGNPPIATQLPTRSTIRPDTIFPEVNGYAKFNGNCPQNILTSCDRNQCPTIIECAARCSNDMQCEGISFIFDDLRTAPCLLKRVACTEQQLKDSPNVRFYKKNENPCSVHLCQNDGICAPGDPLGYQCICPAGFNGRYCEIEDPCLARNNPCQNGARCMPTQDGRFEAVCHCAAGYVGRYCETNTDDCAQLPCIHGICVDGIASYACKCFSGYTGYNCQTEINECDSSPCLNGGQCEDRVDNFHCHCSAPFDGARCEKQYMAKSGSMLPFTCAFESTMCGFTQNVDDQFDWTLNEGSTLSFETGPSSDHTSGSGFYIYMESSSPIKHNDKTRLSSPLLETRQNMVCVTFFYHMYGSSFDMGTLNVYIRSWDGRESLVATHAGNQGNAWRKRQIELQTDDNVQVVLEGIKGYGFQSDIGVDDFNVAYGHCDRDEEQSKQNSDKKTTGLKSGDALFTCDFESDYCGFLQSATDEYEWERISGRTPSTDTGPVNDHTTGFGYYIYTEASFPQSADDRAHLLTPLLPAADAELAEQPNECCLSFYYHMQGAGMGALNIFLHTTMEPGRPSLVWSRLGPKSTEWTHAELSINAPIQSGFQLMFESVRGSTFESDIGLDDVKVTLGSCSPKVNAG